MAGFQEILKSNTWVLVDFYADWCGPCKMMSPEFQKAATFWEGKVPFLKVNVDKNPSASEYYKIQSIPTIILFKNGQVFERKSGAMNASQLNQFISQFLHI